MDVVQKSEKYDRNRLRSAELSLLFLSLLTLYPGVHQWNSFVKLTFWFSVYGLLAVSGIDLMLFIRSKIIGRGEEKSFLARWDRFHALGILLPLLVFGVLFITGRHTEFIVTGMSFFFVLTLAENFAESAEFFLGKARDKKLE